MTRRIVAYLPGYASSAAHGFDIETIPGDMITHLIYGFAGFQQQGSDWIVDWPEPHDSEPHDPKGNTFKLIALKKRWPGLKILVSIGGWDHSHQGDPTGGTTPVFSAVASTVSARQAFVGSCMNLFIKPGYPGLGRLFDGIDIDWEFPVGADRHNFTLLLQEFRTQLDAVGFSDERQVFLSVASSVSSEELELGALGGIVDWVNMMAYLAHAANNNATNKFTDFSAPLYPSPAEPPSNVTWNVDTSVKAFLATGLPPQRIVLGIDAYGHSYAGVAGANNGLYQPYTGYGPGSGTLVGSLRFADIVTNYVQGYVPELDQTTRASYQYSASQQIWISYESTKSLGEKSLYANQENLGGLMLWEISADAPSTPAGRTVPVSLIEGMWVPTVIFSTVNPVFLGETTNLAPALCSHAGRLFLAWTGVGNNDLNVMYSLNDGVSFQGKVTSKEQSSCAPCLVSHNRLNVRTPPQCNLRIGWKASGGNGLILGKVDLIANSAGAFGGIHNIGNLVRLTHSSTLDCALASVCGVLFLTWKGSANDNLNIAYSIDDGRSFEGMWSFASSDCRPALAAHYGNLFVAWKSAGSGTLNVAQVGLKLDSAGKFEAFSGLAGQTSLSETSDNGPALCSYNGRLFLAWTPHASTNVNLVFSSDNGRTFGNGTRVAIEATDTAPALTAHDGILFLAWKEANGNNMVIAQINVPSV